MAINNLHLKPHSRSSLVSSLYLVRPQLVHSLKRRVSHLDLEDRKQPNRLKGFHSALVEIQTTTIIPPRSSVCFNHMMQGICFGKINVSKQLPFSKLLRRVVNITDLQKLRRKTTFLIMIIISDGEFDLTTLIIMIIVSDGQLDLTTIIIMIIVSDGQLDLTTIIIMIIVSDGQLDLTTIIIMIIVSDGQLDLTTIIIMIIVSDGQLDLTTIIIMIIVSDGQLDLTTIIIMIIIIDALLDFTTFIIIGLVDNLSFEGQF